MAQLNKTAAAGANNGSRLDKEEPKNFPLTRVNFIIMAVSAVMIIVGFLLMLGGKTTPEQFNEDIFSTRRIVVGPTISFVGFVAMAVGIIYRPKKK